MSSPIARVFAAVLGALCALPFAPVRALAAEPAAVIFFTGNTYGTISPCPS